MTASNGAEATAIVVEDDPAISDLVELYLRKEGYRVLSASAAAPAVELVLRERPRVVILDVSLDGPSDGYDVCRAIRQKSDVPILFLTARTEEVDRILGLELGADDYVLKPFSPRELVSRVRAVRRRVEVTSRPRVLAVGDVEVDRDAREVRAEGKPVELTTREFDLLAHLADHCGFVLTRRQLLAGVWGEDWFGDERTVDVHVAQLRRKLGPALRLTTVRGIGYRLG